VQVQDYQDAIANLQQVGKLLGESETAATAANKFLDQLVSYKARSPQNQTVMVMRRTPTSPRKSKLV